MNGQHCSHTAGDEAQDSCLVLNHFGLLNEAIGNQRVVFCKKHSTVIPLGWLALHLSRKHRSQCRSILGKHIGSKGNFLSPLVGHIGKVLNIQPTQSKEDILNLELARPMDGLPEPRLSVQCPNCKSWYFYTQSESEPQAKNFRSHVYYSDKTKCRKAWEAAPPGAEENLSIRYAQPVFVGLFGKNKSPKVPLQEGWTPESAQSTGTSTAIPSQRPQVDQQDDEENFGARNEPVADWLNAIGWPEWFDSRSDGNVKPDAKDILQYIALPSYRHVSTSLPKEEQAIENGLRVLYQFTRDYLMDANVFIRSQHIQVRHSLTEGYVD